MDPQEFRDAFQPLLAGLPEGVVAQHGFADLPVDRPPWHATGLQAKKGDRVTLFSAGRAWISEELDLWMPPAFQVWARIDEGGDGAQTGRILRGTRDTHTFEADASGQLQLASYFPGEWSDEHGGFETPPEAWSAVRGGLCVLAVRWAVDPVAGLRSLAALGDPGGLVSGELERLAEPDATPDGWRYLWFLGPAEVYRRRSEDGRDAIDCRTQGDVAILQRDVDVPLTAGTRLAWSWKVDALPSKTAENTPITHDYVSIAAEFENGKDITYTWSCALPPETGYACPLANWTDRETHVVIRSGDSDLGRWLDEERFLRRDYAKHVGDPPQRVVRVWLIAVSLFQRREGRCAYSDIALLDGGARHEVR